jgi:hypothetical protein
MTRRTCLLTGHVTFRAEDLYGTYIRHANAGRRVPVVRVRLPSRTRDHSAFSMILAGSYRDDPHRANALCRGWDEIRPEYLDLTIGNLAFRVSNRDPHRYAAPVVGCHGWISVFGSVNPYRM